MKHFTVIDEPFTCENCGYKVPKLNYTARDHCPNCLYSKHVDNNPGDRSASCGGLLIPIGVEKASKGDYKIIYRCQKCGHIKKNVMAKDDNYDLIVKLSTNNIN